MNKHIFLQALTLSLVLCQGLTLNSQQTAQTESFAGLLPANNQIQLSPGQLKQTFTLTLPYYNPNEFGTCSKGICSNTGASCSTNNDCPYVGLYDLYTFTPTAGPLTTANPTIKPALPIYFLIQTTNQVGQTNQNVKTPPSSAWPNSPGINLWVMSPAYVVNASCPSPGCPQALDYTKPVPLTYAQGGKPGCLYAPPFYNYNNNIIPAYPIPNLGPNSTIDVTVTAEGTVTINDPKAEPIPMGCITNSSALLSCTQSS